ncbi:MAG TPA: hypothetical protein VFG30_41380 [Polyangiales bacterium]|nr:hypothetical protein [Polyangiales bacterium]
MKQILWALDEISKDPFNWDYQQANPLAALTAAGLEPEQAAQMLADLRRERVHPQDSSWHSCDSCFDPGSDRDPFDPPAR